ncbi:MAG TPA: alkaline phosphatase family protein [Planctomycetota bacterium]|nr:alkaline phosphatase family protein [Planctomycetota bacterium]
MPIDPSQIKTLVIVMMENRSFDHLLGYLSLPPFSRADVEGLKADPAWNQAVANEWNGQKYAPFHLTDLAVTADPPHERAPIAMQLGAAGTGDYPLNGFVANFATVENAIDPQHPPAVMGYYTPAEVPITHFFAQNYGICDHWFSTLPASTQPNRLMAMAGFSMIDGNASFLGFPSQDLVYDWLTKHQVRWRVYHDGMPFFTLMKRWIPEILSSGIGGELDDPGSHFRSLQQLVVDVQEESPDTFPEVIFVEPKYSDAPPAGHGRDDHPPAVISGGQAFLWEVYLALSSKPERWASTAMVVTYDEHGGFFDHVQPLRIATPPPPGANYPPFVSTGLRVPSMIVSPFMSAGSVFHGSLDHTSILKFLGEKFNGGSYSAPVDARNGVGSLSEVFDRAIARTDIPTPPTPAGTPAAETVQSAAFAAAAQASYTQNPQKAKRALPETWHV